MSVIHVTRSYAVPDETRSVREDPRWCFLCRKRLPGTTVLMIEPPGSYYDHWSMYECDGCAEDHRYFPGCWPE